jgi:hypothetical protein
MVTNILLLPLMAYAAAGLVLSLTVHLLSFADVLSFPFGGGAPPLGLFIALHVGIFPLWIPVMLILWSMTVGRRSQDVWQHILAECPVWMKYMIRVFFAYAVVNFVLGVALLIFVYPKNTQHGGSPPGVVWRLFSGHWMAFYSAGLVTLTAAWRRGLSNLRRRCVNGHTVAYGDRFCPTCGATLDTTPGLVDRAVNV